MQKQLKLIVKNKDHYNNNNSNFVPRELNTQNYRDILFYYNKENFIKDSPLFTLNRETYQAILKNGIYTNIFMLLSKYFFKIKEFF